MDVVIAPGTNRTEINKIKAFGTIELQNPTKNAHPKGTKIAQRQGFETTKTPVATTGAGGPCGVVTTTAAAPCAVATTTKNADPCATVKKFDAKDAPSKTSQKTQVSTLGLLGWGFGGFAGVAVAMYAVRKSRRSDSRDPYVTFEEKMEGALE